MGNENNPMGWGGSYQNTPTNLAHLTDLKVAQERASSSGQAGGFGGGSDLPVFPFYRVITWGAATWMVFALGTHGALSNPLGWLYIIAVIALAAIINIEKVKQFVYRLVFLGIFLSFFISAFHLWPKVLGWSPLPHPPIQATMKAETKHHAHLHHE